MDRNFSPGDRQVQASAGKHSQYELQVLQVLQVQSPQELPVCVLGGSTFDGVLAHAVLHSGFDQNQLARRLHISEGYMSRFLKGVAAQWAKRLVLFMRETKSLGPLQWLADQVGCDVVLRDKRAAEVAALTARLRELGQAA